MQFLRVSLASMLVLTTLFACAANGQTPVLEAANDASLTSEPRVVTGPRIVAIGDIHGDFERFVAVLKSTGLIDQKKKWSGGSDTLVQVGDITDRGPDSRKAIDLLRKLKKQAAKAGGRVEVVIGNHEVMNMIGDLRYVHPGEYQAFKDRNSKKRLDIYYKQTVAALKAATPEGEPFELDKNHRTEWNKRFPIGYVEHRLGWAPSGEYGEWVLSNSAAVKVGNAVFVHGGIASAYADMSLSDMNTRVRTELADPRKLTPGAIIDDVQGPFWYRGWAQLPETAENEAALDRILASLGVGRMVIAHTPLINTVLPRFGGKVLMVDVGMSAHYGGANAALELIGDKAFANIAGQRVELPSSKAGVIDYLTTAKGLVEDGRKIERYIAKLIAEQGGKIEAVEPKAVSQ